jgi:hypothetical protein
MSVTNRLATICLTAAISVLPVLELIAEETETGVAGLVYPGPTPGIACATSHDSRLVLENDLLVVRWDLTDGLRLVEAVDKTTRQVWSTGSSECVQLVIHESPSPVPRILTGSEMKVVGRPVVSEAPVSDAATRRSMSVSGKQIVVRLAAPDDILTVEWRATLRDDANYVRQTVVLLGGDEWVELDQVILVDLPGSGAVVQGSVDGSPAVVGRWFTALEHPMSRTEVAAAGPRKEQRIRCGYQFAPPLEPGRPQRYSSVLGLTPPGQLRRGFLYYLELERAHPYRPFLHHNVAEDAGHIYSKKPT